MESIRFDREFTRIEAIHKGWSGDRKYCGETKDGEKVLIRVSSIKEYREKKQEFELMEKFTATGIRMSQPLSFGTCEEGKSVAQILTWIEGDEAKEVLPSLSQRQQYAYGQEAGRMMLQMQRAESYPSSSRWKEMYTRRLSDSIKAYKDCGETLYGEPLLFSVLEKNADALENRPLSLLHADFQSDNMVISPDQKLYAIDFQGSGLVDPYYALTGVMVTAEVSPIFSMGELHTYFNGPVPEDFWRLNAFYLAAECINAFSVAVNMGQEEIDYSNQMMKTTLEWFDDFRSLIPSWYEDPEQLKIL